MVARIDESKGRPETYIPADQILPVEQQAIKHEHQWKLGDIINNLIAAGLAV